MEECIRIEFKDERFGLVGKKVVSGLNVRMKGLVWFEWKAVFGLNVRMKGLVWFERKAVSGLNVSVIG